MSSVQPVFFQLNTDRREQFLIETKIWNKKGLLYAEKRAVYPAAAAHLQRMCDTYNTLLSVKALRTHIQIVEPIQAADNILRFSYVDGLPAERVLLEHVLAENHSAVKAFLDKIFLLVESLPGVRVNPTTNPNYVKVFGNSFGKTSDCTETGLIDLNLDNIIIDTNAKWHLFDYEWLFDFPVPKQFLRMRILWYFLARHKEILRYHAQHIDSVCMGKTIYIPKFLLPYCRDSIQFLDDWRHAERLFQTYVTGKPDHKFFFTDTKADFTVEAIDPPLVGIEALIRKNVQVETQKLRRELQALHKQHLAQQRKLTAITSSKTYRVAHKLAAAKRKLVPTKPVKNST